MIAAILYFSLVLLSSGQIYSEDKLFFVDDIGETGVEEIICSLTSVKPYYDCSEKWIIYLYDEKFPEICNQHIAIGIASKACTKYTTFGDDVISATINLGNEHGSQSSFPFPDGPEFQTVLFHELQHAICGCTWHTEISYDFIN